MWSHATSSSKATDNRTPLLCRVVTHEHEDPEGMRAAVCRILGALGMVPTAPVLPAPPPPGHLCVQASRGRAGWVGRVVVWGGHLEITTADQRLSPLPLPCCRPLFLGVPLSPTPLLHPESCAAGRPGGGPRACQPGGCHGGTPARHQGGQPGGRGAADAGWVLLKWGRWVWQLGKRASGFRPTGAVLLMSSSHSGRVLLLTVPTATIPPPPAHTRRQAGGAT